MSQLPEYFEYPHSKGENSRFWPISYLAEQQAFKVATIVIPQKEFNPFSFNVHKYAIENPGVPTEDLSKYPLLDTYLSNPMATPMFHSWTVDNKERIINEVPAVMYQVYNDLNLSIDVDYVTGGGHTGFAARVKEDGAVNLQVLGDCACMGVQQMGGAALNGMEYGFGQYELHNTDHSFQIVSLYAGLGHIARLASGRDLDQGRLFDPWVL